jgi:hypothetical protein
MSRFIRDVYGSWYVMDKLTRIAVEVCLDNTWGIVGYMESSTAIYISTGHQTSDDAQQLLDSICMK